MKPITTLRRLSPAERLLLAEAAVTLCLAALAIRLLPFRRTVGFGAISLGSKAGLPLPSLLWAIDAAARRMPFRAACFERGLAAQRMLRRRGQDARLHYGVAPGERLQAHVWVTLRGTIVEGAATAARHTEVGAWP